MHHTVPAAGRRRVPAATRRLLPVVLAAGTAAFAAPASAAVSVNPVADQIVATAAVPNATPATLTVTRTDALDGHQVVIGRYSDNVDGGVMAVNTAFVDANNNDCWEGPQGQLRQWTPDLRAGDTVTFAVTGLAPETVTVPGDNDQLGGPVAGCAPQAPYARNAVTATSVATITPASFGAPVVVAGEAQPFTSAVQVTLADSAGRAVTQAAFTNPLGGRTTWSVSFAPSQVATLGDGPLSIDAVYSILGLDDAGTPGRIRGAVPVALAKATAGAALPGATPPATTPAGTTPAGTTPGGTTPAGTTPAAAGALRVTGVATRRRQRLSTVRRRGLRVSFTVPAGARFARVELRRAGRRIGRRIVAVRPGRRTVVLRGALLRSVRRGRYTVAVSVGATRTQFAARTLVRVRVV